MVARRKAAGVKHYRSGQFKPGSAPKSPGRTKGVPNKSTRMLKEATLMAAELTGYDRKGKEGLVGYLRSIAEKHPTAFVSLLNKILPLQIAGDKDRPVVVTLDDKLLDALAAQSPDKVRLLRDVLTQVGGDDAKIIDMQAHRPKSADPARYGATLASKQKTGV